MEIFKLLYQHIGDWVEFDNNGDVVRGRIAGYDNAMKTAQVVCEPNDLLSKDGNEWRGEPKIKLDYDKLTLITNPTK